MHFFEYKRPETLEETLSLLATHRDEARILAGGTDLLVQIRSGRHQPAVVIDPKRVPELLPPIRDDGNSLWISALALLADLVKDKGVRHHFPALVEAASEIGSVQIRNRATLAGNICNASPAADTIPPLLVHRAIFHIANQDGRRQVPADEFFLGPGRTVLAPDEMLVAIELPYPTEAVGAAFARLTRRRGVDLATSSTCCLVKASGETLLAFGAAAPTPVLAKDTSGVLANLEIASAEKEEVLRQLIAHTSPISDVRASKTYREAMLIVLSKRALEKALARLMEGK